MLVTGVVLVAFSILFSLTTMALWASGRARRPLSALASLAVLLVAGLVLLVE